ncbi:hypothetical protein BJ165DRAFT_1513748 [Panaeolus papilionaceus]|nr:hypothetical protein BJ165DRAFT_1513748 [Panaeolus papilionaceus]
MADTVAPSTPPATPTPNVSDSPKLKQKWTSRMGTVVRRASKRFSIHRMHSHDQSPDKAEKSKGSTDLKRTSTSASSASTTKSSLGARHVKSESAPAAVAAPPSSSDTEEAVASVSPPTSDPSTTTSSTLQDSTVLDKSIVIVPLAAPTETAVAAVSPPGTEQAPETHTHIALPAAVATESDDSSAVKSVPRPSSTPEPVLVQVNLDESMVEVVIPFEEEEDDAAAAPLPLNAAAAAEERVEHLEEMDKGVRFAEDVHVIESRTTEDDDEATEIAKEPEADVIPEPVAEPEVQQPTSEEDQHLLDSILVPREEDAISIVEPTSQPEIVVEIPKSSSSSHAPTATVTVVSAATREEPSSSSSSDKSSSSPATTFIFALISGAIVGVGALAYAGVIAGLSVGGIVAGVGGSIVTGLRGKRRARA